MIATRAKAEEAIKLLASYGNDVEVRLTDLETLSVHRGRLDELYRAAAKCTHPDVGGSAEAFARVDWAKHVLTKWLTRDTPKVATVYQPCRECNGLGHVRMQRGFKQSAPIQCAACHGSGDAHYDADRSAGKRD